jgi:hypothetical protein
MRLAAAGFALVVTLAARGASADPPVDPPNQEGTTARDVVAYSSLGLGAAALVVGIVETTRWVSLDNQAQTDRQQVPATVTDVCASQVNGAAADACQKGKDAGSADTIAWIAYGSALALGTTGIVLLLTKPHATSDGGKVAVTPAVSPRGGGLQLRIAF